VAITFLDNKNSVFPNVNLALAEPNGLLAAGGDLSVNRLLDAYSKGIFPWYSEFLEDGSPSPILWWCPKPRCVLFLDQLKVSRSLKKSIKKTGFDVSCDHAFRETIQGCANDRAKSTGTWINPAIQDAYCALHEIGYAHSIECWHDGKLVGGLYGVALGKMFYGESMFSQKTDASKVALVFLCSLLKAQGAQIVDCQVANPHLISLGASEIALENFIRFLESDCYKAPLQFPTDKMSAIKACAIYL